MITKDMLKKAFDHGLDHFCQSLNRQMAAKRVEDSQGQLLPDDSGQAFDLGKLVGHFVIEYQKRYGAKARPDVGGKTIGIFKRMMRDYNFEQMKVLITVYMQIEDEWIKKQYHNAATFEAQIQRVLHAATTGQKAGTLSGLDKFKLKMEGEQKELT